MQRSRKLLSAHPPDRLPVAGRLVDKRVIISLVGWTELARVVRGRFLALRSQTFVTAAWLDGCGQGRIILRHMLPSLASHIIASVTLAIALMIQAEPSL